MTVFPEHLMGLYKTDNQTDELTCASLEVNFQHCAGCDFWLVDHPITINLIFIEETFLVGQIPPERTEASYMVGVLASLLVAIMNQANVEKPNL